MTEDDDEVFAACLTALAATFGRAADEPLFEGYRMALDDLPIETIKRAVKTAIRTCKFMPSGRELRELAGEMAPWTWAVKAWEAFDRAVQQHGYYSSVNFDDAVINATVWNLGGWEKVSEIEGEEFSKWLRKDFERVYAGLMQAGISPSQARPLVGFHERQNRFNGYLAGDVLTLGDCSQRQVQAVEFATGLPKHLDERLQVKPALAMESAGPLRLSLKGPGD